MTDFKAIMHQIRFRLWLRPRPRWGSLQRSPDPLAGFDGLLLREEKGRGRRREGGKWGGEEREGREGRGEEEAFLVMWPRRLSALNPPLGIVGLLC